jgi:hypothetical protein
METGIAFLSDLKFSPPSFYEYLLVVHPAAEVFEQLREEKKNFRKHIK